MQLVSGVAGWTRLIQTEIEGTSPLRRKSMCFPGRIAREAEQGATKVIFPSPLMGSTTFDKTLKKTTRCPMS